MGQSETPLHIDNRKDLLLLILAAPGENDAEPVVGVTRLQKYLFLLQREHGWDQKYEVTEPYQFKPYDFGPFDSRLYDDLELLENANLVKREPAGPEPNVENEEFRRLAQDWATVDRELAPWEEQNQILRFSLTPQGREFVARYELEHEEWNTLGRSNDGGIAAHYRSSCTGSTRTIRTWPRIRSSSTFGHETP